MLPAFLEDMVGGATRRERRRAANFRSLPFGPGKSEQLRVDVLKSVDKHKLARCRHRRVRCEQHCSNGWQAP